MTIQSLPVGILGSVGNGAPAYDPGMMTFNGTDAWYQLGGFVTNFTGNVLTLVARFNRASFTGGADERIFTGLKTANSPFLLVYPSDHATSTRRNKLSLLVQDGSTVCRIFSTIDVTTGGDFTVFAEYDATAGTVKLFINGFDRLDAGNPEHTLTTGTLVTGTYAYAVGATANAPTNYFGGEIGYLGFSNVSGLTPSDFYHPTNGLQELDESGWTEWGSQPLFWNQFGTMDDNKGSAGNMTENGGPITGPA